jgi:predicted permease
MINLTPMYIAMSVIALLVIFLLVFFVKKGKKQKKLSALAGLSFAFVIAGIVFGSSRILGYSLIGIGIVLAITDMMRKSKKK